MKKRQGADPATGSACRCAGNGVYPAAAFRRIIDRECHRADRNFHGFSVAVFPLPPDTPSAASRLAQVLTARVRCTDEVGWLEDGVFGVLLPETHGDGGWLFGRKILAEMERQGLRASCRVYAYPSQSAITSTHSAAQLWFKDMADSAGTPRRTVELADLGDGFHPFDEVPPPAEIEAELSQEAEVCWSLNQWMAEPPVPWKRAIDIVGSSLGLLLAVPLMLVIAVAIKVVSSGPVLFRQKRVGYRGRVFECLKFRTMRVNASQELHAAHVKKLMESDAPMLKLDSSNDPRLIPCGALLRVTGLDELPQLFNVLKGEMSLIGPRPCIPYEYEQYERWHRGRTGTLPGITGLWQVSGKNSTTVTEMMRLDIAYARRRGFGMDLWIMLRTLPAVLRQMILTRKNASRGEQAMGAGVKPAPRI